MVFLYIIFIVHKLFPWCPNHLHVFKLWFLTLYVILHQWSCHLIKIIILVAECEHRHICEMMLTLFLNFSVLKHYLLMPFTLQCISSTGNKLSPDFFNHWKVFCWKCTARGSYFLLRKRRIIVFVYVYFSWLRIWLNCSDLMGRCLCMSKDVPFWETHHLIPEHL